VGPHPPIAGTPRENRTADDQGPNSFAATDETTDRQVVSYLKRALETGSLDCRFSINTVGCGGSSFSEHSILAR